MIPYKFRVSSLSEVRDFVESNHYSKSVNGIKISHVFVIEYGENIVGAMIFGAMSTTAWKKFGSSESDVIELRRLVCIDDTPRNTESWFIGQALRWLKRNSNFKIVVSYADPNHGHSGVIYRASNFRHVGMSGKDFGYRDTVSGKIYHSRALRTKYKGDYKPFVKRLREKLANNELDKIDLLPKHCYTFSLSA